MTHIKIIIYEENILAPSCAGYTVRSVLVLPFQCCQYSVGGLSTVQ